jgi:Flp pilus assembly pilin Flp
MSATEVEFSPSLSLEELTADLKEHKMHKMHKLHKLIGRLWFEDAGQDIAEYAVMLAVILVLVVGTVRLIGSKSSTVFSNVASSIQ